jgi:hypothetical protein
MKTQVLLALIGATSAVKVSNPNAAPATPCQQAGQTGVNCEPKAGSGFFANGMFGHEDLGKDISMKGIDYHYAQREKDEKPCACGTALCEQCNPNSSLVQDGHVDNMGYSKFVHPYFPGTTTANFRIQQGGKCLEWDRDGNTGNDQHRVSFQTCNDTNHQQWWNFHQMSRTIRAYSRNNFVLSNREGNNWTGSSYEAVMRPW